MPRGQHSPALDHLMHFSTAVLLASFASSLAAQDPPLLGDHLEPAAAIDREHAHHASLHGTVLDADGAPVPGAQVYVYSQLPWWGAMAMAAATADAEGRFRIDDFEAIGALALFATTPRGAPFAGGWWSIGLVSGRATELRPVPLPAPIAGATTHTFRGRLVDGAGAPIAGALWRLHHEGGFDPGAFAVTDADGGFEVKSELGKPHGGTLFVGNAKYELEHKDGAADLDAGAGLFHDLDLAAERTIRAPQVRVLQLPAGAVAGATFHRERGGRLAPCPGSVPVLVRFESSAQTSVWMRAPGRLPRQGMLPGGAFDVAADQLRSLRVVDDTGAPVASAIVDVCGSWPAGRLQETTLATFRTGADGVLALQGPADEYVVYAYAGGHAPARARWRAGATPEVVLARCTARLEVTTANSTAALYVRRAGTFASCAKLYPQAGMTTIELVPGDYELTVYDAQGIAAAKAIQVAGVTKIPMPTEDQRPELTLAVHDARDGDACWAYASRSGVGGMIAKWMVHTQRGGQMQRHELAATVDALDAQPGAGGIRRFRVRPPTSGRYTLLVSNGVAGVRYFREGVFAFGGSYALELPPVSGVLTGTVAKYPELWAGDFLMHGVVGPRLCLEPLGKTPSGALVALPEPAQFRLVALPTGTFALHHHLYETGVWSSSDGTWGGVPLAIAATEPAVVQDLARGPDADLTVQVRDRAGQPLSGRLRVRDRMFECWSDDLQQNTTLDDAMDPIPTPPAAELDAGRCTLPKVRAGRLQFVLERDDGASVHFARDVEPGKMLDVVLDVALDARRG